MFHSKTDAISVWLPDINPDNVPPEYRHKKVPKSYFKITYRVEGYRNYDLPEGFIRTEMKSQLKDNLIAVECKGESDVEPEIFI